MDIVNFDALTANNRIIDPSQVDPEEDYFILGKYTNHYTTNSQKYTKYPVYAIKAGDVMGGYTPPYKIYTALLTQVDMENPTAIVLENTIGNIKWTRDAAGEYSGTLFGAFGDGSKVFLQQVLSYGGAFSSVGVPNDKLVRGYYISPDTVGVFSYIEGAGADDQIDNVSIEIRIYN